MRHCSADNGGAIELIALKTILQELEKPNSHAGGIFFLILSFDAK
jgi:hypothetical protein